VKKYKVWLKEGSNVFIITGEFLREYQSTRVTGDCTYTHICVNDFISHSVFVFAFFFLFAVQGTKIHLSMNMVRM
jgi:hypothetical protein